jgi:hypothetical protein
MRQRRRELTSRELVQRRQQLRWNDVVKLSLMPNRLRHLRQMPLAAGASADPRKLGEDAVPRRSSLAVWNEPLEIKKTVFLETADVSIVQFHRAPRPHDSIVHDNAAKRRRRHLRNAASGRRRRARGGASETLPQQPARRWRSNANNASPASERPLGGGTRVLSRRRRRSSPRFWDRCRPGGCSRRRLAVARTRELRNDRRRHFREPGRRPDPASAAPYDLRTRDRCTGRTRERHYEFWPVRSRTDAEQVMTGALPAAPVVIAAGPGENSATLTFTSSAD